MDLYSAKADAASTAVAPPAPEPALASPPGAPPPNRGRNTLPPRARHPPESGGYRDHWAVVPRAPVGGAPPHRGHELMMQATPMSRGRDFQWGLRGDPRYRHDIDFLRWPRAAHGRGGPQGYGGGDAPPTEGALRALLLREKEEGGARLRNLERLRQREQMLRIAEEEGGGLRLPVDRADVGAGGCCPPPLPPPEPAKLTERRRDIEMLHALRRQEQRVWREEEDEAHHRRLASLAQQQQQQQQQRDMDLGQLERRLMAERLAHRGDLDRRLRGFGGGSHGAVAAEGGRHPHSQLLLSRNGVLSRVDKEKSIIVPCQARGMSMEHNFKTAYFTIPEEIEHGEELICSFPPCRNSGIKFRFCRVCGTPAPKRNFLNRHGHGFDGFGAISDEGDEAEGGGVAPPTEPPANPPPDERKLAEAERVSSVTHEKRAEESRGTTMTVDERMSRWADLLGKRPRTDDSRGTSAWLLEVLEVSDLGTPLEEINTQPLAKEGYFGPDKRVRKY